MLTHPGDLSAARRRDEQAFERLVAPHRAGLHAHCYRMLGSTRDAEDALQETLLRAWRGLARFEERSSLSTWLYRIATNACLRTIERRPRRTLPLDAGPPSDPSEPFGPPAVESSWIEPCPDGELDDGPASPHARYEQRESVELAFTAALQHLPARQRAVLLLRDVLGFAPREIADALDTTPASVYSALQRARRAAAERLPERSQQATLRAVGDRRLREVVTRYVEAWEAGDVAAITALLTDDAVLAMPPRPEWYRGRAAIGTFLAAVPFRMPRRWRHLTVGANGQLATAVYAASEPHGPLAAVAIELLTFEGDRIAAMTSFHGPEVLTRFGLPAQLDG